MGSHQVPLLGGPAYDGPYPMHPALSPSDQLALRHRRPPLAPRAVDQPRRVETRPQAIHTRARARLVPTGVLRFAAVLYRASELGRRAGLRDPSSPEKVGALSLTVAQRNFAWVAFVLAVQVLRAVEEEEERRGVKEHKDEEDECAARTLGEVTGLGELQPRVPLNDSSRKKTTLC
ncbi:hypothetical protein P7C73_g6637, partial [Tremellales sp. Uapishka_1]